MPLVDRPPGNAISFDPLPVSSHPYQRRVQNPPLQIPDFPLFEIASIEELPDPSVATATPDDV
jgi:hypothetical protein